MSRHPLADHPIALTIHWIGGVAVMGAGSLIAQTTGATAATSGALVALFGFLGLLLPPGLQLWFNYRVKRLENDQKRWEEDREDKRRDFQRQIDESNARAAAAEAKAHQAAAEAQETKRRLASVESKTYQVADKVEATVDKVVATQTVAAGNQGDLEGLKERMQKQGAGVGGTGPILQGQTRLLPTILVVEDDKDTMEVVCKRFSAAGFSVTKAPDLAEASYQIAKGPHWVFTDVRLLGGQDGLDLVRLIRRDELPINVVVCSGYVDDPAVRAKLDSLRPDVVVGKPLMDADFDRLLDRMRAVPRAAGRGGGRPDGPRPA